MYKEKDLVFNSKVIADNFEKLEWKDTFLLNLDYNIILFLNGYFYECLEGKVNMLTMESHSFRRMNYIT